MGNTQATHNVFVKTGIKKGAGTDGNVYFKFGDSTGKWSSELKLDTRLRNDFESGDTNVFSVNLPDLDKVTELAIRRDGRSENDSWYLEKIVIKSLITKKDLKVESSFPVNRFIHANTELKLSEFDSSLPAHDKHPEQRTKELEKKRDLYQPSKEGTGVFSQVKELPEDEEFNFQYTVFLGGTLAQLGVETKLADVLTGDFRSLSDFEEVYIGCKVNRPEGIYKWRDDAEFGNQRIAGVNPAVIELCKKIPDNFKVTSDMVEPFLEGKTLKQAMDEGKVYIVDYSFLQDLVCFHGQKICAPYGLFYVAKNGDFMPIAIQLDSKPAEDNPVFIPSDPEYTWLTAKMWFNLADSSVHQSSTHLGFTHLLMESVALCANRQLSPSHPVYRLLAPHFLYIMAINSAALVQLIAPGAWVDQAMQIGREGMLNIIKRKFENWNLMEDGHLINNLKKRGVYSTDSLSNYPYRDDAILLWNAINKYVAHIVNAVYDTSEKLVADHELQSFATELTSSEGAGIQGIPLNFTNNEELIEVLTTFIFTCSVQHAAVNFGQYDEYGFSPNYPASIRTERPTNKSPLTEEDVVKSLPTKDTMLQVILITKTLSSKATDSLGYFDTPFAADPVSLTALKHFRKELKEISDIIEERNGGRLRKYPVLHPQEIPNAISI